MSLWNAHTSLLTSLFVVLSASIRLNVDRRGLYSCGLSGNPWGVTAVPGVVPTLVDTGSVSHILIPPTCVVNDTKESRACRTDDKFPFRWAPHREPARTVVSFASGAVVGGWIAREVDAGLRCAGDVPHRIALTDVLVAEWMNDAMARAIHGYGGILAASPQGLQRWHPDETVHFLPATRAPSSAAVRLSTDEPLRVYVDAVEVGGFAVPIREWCVIDSGSLAWIAVPRLHVYTLRRGLHDNSWSTTLTLRWGGGCAVDLSRHELPHSPHEGGVAIAKGAVQCVLGAPFVRAAGMSLRKDGGGSEVLVTLGARDATCNPDDKIWRWLIAAVLLALVVYTVLRWQGVIPRAAEDEDEEEE